MPRAEVGTPKWVANQSRRKGLQRLRWYCQVCAKQCPDENGFKQHSLSEGHVRAMHLIGEDPQKYIKQYTQQFQDDFLSLLRTSHGTKQVGLNRFYNEYIADKEHVHMNATTFSSLTEFAKHLGRSGLCVVTEAEDEKEQGGNNKTGVNGVLIAWVDSSPEAARRREFLAKRERMEKTDAERETKSIQDQVERARKAMEKKELEDRQRLALDGDENGQEVVDGGLKQAVDGNEEASSTTETIKLDINFKLSLASHQSNNTIKTSKESKSNIFKKALDKTSRSDSNKQGTSKITASKSSKNFFSKQKKNNRDQSQRSRPAIVEPPKKMSEAERIMREEMEQKRKSHVGFGSNPSLSKKQKT